MSRYLPTPSLLTATDGAALYQLVSESGDPGYLMERLSTSQKAALDAHQAKVKDDMQACFVRLVSRVRRGLVLENTAISAN